MLVFWFKNLLGALLLPPANGLPCWRWRRCSVADAGRAGWAGRAGCCFCCNRCRWSAVRCWRRSKIAPACHRRPERGAGDCRAGAGMVETLPSLGGETSLARPRHAGPPAPRGAPCPQLASAGAGQRRPSAEPGLFEAEVMARISEQEFAVPVRWREDGSRDTAEKRAEVGSDPAAAGNPPHCAAGTQPYHLPRAERLFRAAGLRGAVNAPAQFTTQNGRAGLALSDFIPRGLGAGVFLPRPPRMAGHRLGQPDGALRCGGTNGRGSDNLVPLPIKITRRPSCRTPSAFTRPEAPRCCAGRRSTCRRRQPGEATVRHHAVGLNFIDTYHCTGPYPLPLPAGIGLEGAGVVEAVGAGVSEVKVGDRVAYAGGPVGAYAEVRTCASPCSRCPMRSGSILLPP